MGRSGIASAVVVAVIGFLVLGYLGSMIFDDGQSYDIEYELDDGTLSDSAIKSYVSGKETDLPIPYKTGYTFIGWFLDSEYNKPIGSITKDLKGDLKLYALWYSGTFVGNKVTLTGTGSAVYEITGYDNGVSSHKITVGSHTITYSDGDGNVHYVENSAVDGWNCAVWKVDSLEIYMYCGTPMKIVYNGTTYTNNDAGFDIEYNLNGGTLSSDCKDKYLWGGELVLSPAYKDGFYFDGWYADSSFSLPVVKFTKSSSSFTLYAKWSTQSPIGNQYDAGNTVLKAYNYDCGKTYYVIQEDSAITESFWTYSDKVSYDSNGSIVKWSVGDYTIELDGNVIKRIGKTTLTDVTKSEFVVKEPRVYIDKCLVVSSISSIEFGKPVSITVSGSVDTWFINDKEYSGYTYNSDEFLPGTTIIAKSTEVKQVNSIVYPRDLGLSGTIELYDNNANKLAYGNADSKFQLEAGNYIFIETGKNCNYFVYVESGSAKLFKWSCDGKNYSWTLYMYSSDVNKYKEQYPMKEYTSKDYNMKDNTRMYLYYDGQDTDEAFSEYVQKFFCKDNYVTKLASDLKELYESKNGHTYSRADYANYILHFVGKIPYVTDMESTRDMLYVGFPGFEEYYKFPAETLYDQCGDCEDFSILYAALMKESGYDTGIVTSPNHMMAILALENGPSDGKKFTHDGKTYYFCETTSVFDVGKLDNDASTGATTDVSRIGHIYYLDVIPSTS